MQWLTARRDGITNEFVNVEVGVDKEVFTVHKDLLTRCSPYFKVAFEGKFREATEKAIPIPHVTTTQFRLFLDWLYFQRLPPLETQVGSENWNNCRHEHIDCTLDEEESEIKSNTLFTLLMSDWSTLLQLGHGIWETFMYLRMAATYQISAKQSSINFGLEPMKTIYLIRH